MKVQFANSADLWPQKAELEMIRWTVQYGQYFQTGIPFSIQFIERDLRKRGDVDQDICIHGAPTPEPLSRLPKYEGATNLRYEQRSMNAESQEQTILNTQ